MATTDWKEVGVGPTEEKEEKGEEKETDRQLPQPSGYRILCALPKIDTKFESGLLKSDETIHVEELLTTVLFVLK
jgi:hypothetical protein